MKYIKVKNTLWFSRDTQIQTKEGLWIGMRPELLAPNPIERFKHRFIGHFTFGQPYCVVCGKASV